MKALSCWASSRILVRDNDQDLLLERSQDCASLLLQHFYRPCDAGGAEGGFEGIGGLVAVAGLVAAVLPLLGLATEVPAATGG